MSVLQSLRGDADRKQFSSLELEGSPSSGAADPDVETVRLLMRDDDDGDGSGSHDLDQFAMDSVNEADSHGAAGDHPDADGGMDVSSPQFADFAFSSYQSMHGDSNTMATLHEDATDLFGPASPSSALSASVVHSAAGFTGYGEDAGAGTTERELAGDEEIAHKGEDTKSEAAPIAAAARKTGSTAAPVPTTISIGAAARASSVAAKSSRDKQGSGAPVAPRAHTLDNTSSAVQRQSSLDVAVSDDGSQDSNAHGGGTSLLEEPISDEFGLVLNDVVSSIELRGPGSVSGGGGHRQSFIGKDDRSGPDVAPPWSELKTKAGKERKRLPLACIACRRKKIRCSGEKPACKHCLRSRMPCVYKVTARKAAPRTDYMAMLDKRLKRMEDRIIKIVPKAEQDPAVTSSVTRAVVKPAIPGAVGSGSANGAGAAGSSVAGAKASSSKKRVADDAFGPELDHWARLGSKSKPDGLTGPHNVLLQQESEENKLLQEGAEALPSRELQEHLAEVFFENIYGQAYHLLHRPSYMRKLRQVILFRSSVFARVCSNSSF